MGITARNSYARYISEDDRQWDVKIQSFVNFRHKKSTQMGAFSTKQQRLLLAAKCTEALVETINTAASV